MTVVVCPDYGYAFISAQPGKTSSFVEGDPAWAAVNQTVVIGGVAAEGVVRRTARTCVIEVAGVPAGGRLRVASNGDPTTRMMLLSGAPGAIQLESFHTLRLDARHNPLGKWIPQALSSSRVAAEVKVVDNLVCDFTFQAGMGSPAVGWSAHDLFFESGTGKISPTSSMYNGSGIRMQQSMATMALPGCGSLLEALRVCFGDYIVGQAPTNMEAMVRSALQRWVQSVCLNLDWYYNGRVIDQWMGSGTWVTPFGDGAERNYFTQGDLRCLFASTWNVLGIPTAVGPLVDQVHAPGSVWLVVDGQNSGDTIQIKKGV